MEETKPLLGKNEPRRWLSWNLKMPNEVDGWFSWFTIIPTFVSFFLVLGIVYSFGLLVIPLIEEFHSNRQNVSFCISICNFMMLGSGGVTGYIAEVWSYRAVYVVGTTCCILGFILASFSTNLILIYITFSVIAGCGFSCVLIISIAIMSQWFEKYRGMSTGLGIAGSGFGSLLLPPFISFITEHYGWRNTFRFFALLFFACYGCTFLLIKRDMEKNSSEESAKLEKESEKHSSEDDYEAQKRGEIGLQTEQRLGAEVKWRDDGEHEKKEKETVIQLEEAEADINIKIASNVYNDPNAPFWRIVFTKFFWFYYVANFLTFLAYFVPFVHIVPFAIDHGVSETERTVILMAMGGSTIFGRIVLGYIADKIGRLRMVQISSFFLGVSDAAWLWCTKFWLLLIYGIVYAIFAGSMMALMTPVISDEYGVRQLAGVSGLIFTSAAVGSLIGSPLAGLIYDRRKGIPGFWGGYTVAIIGTSVIMFGSFSIFMFTRHSPESAYEKRKLHPTEKHKSTLTQE